MQLAKITSFPNSFSFLLFSVLAGSTFVNAQDNSPYSRYGLGNQFPRTGIVSRGMGGITAGYTDITSVNFSNPASYAGFAVRKETRTNKLENGRVVLDAGLSLDSRKLSQPNSINSFTSTDALFSHLYVGVPIRKNWGLAFGIRPISRISYDVFKRERLKDPRTGLPIDSAITQFTGTGGSFLPTIGTGFGSDHFTVGVNIGYLFGKKSLTTRRGFLNDSVEYAAADYTSSGNFGSVFFETGAQYTVDLSKTSLLRFGVDGNWKQTLSGTQDILRQTYINDANGQELRVDSVFQKNDVSGEVVYPASYTAGVYYEKAATGKRRGLSLGLDYNTMQWSAYRFFGAADQVQNSWEIRAGGQLTPYAFTSLGQRLTYRFGAFYGADYIKVDNKLPIYGASFGVGVPLIPSRQSPNQFSVINLALEYSKRGNDNNQIKEGLLRFSVGFNFTDLWFIKRKSEND